MVWEPDSGLALQVRLDREPLTQVRVHLTRSPEGWTSVPPPTGGSSGRGEARARAAHEAGRVNFHHSRARIRGDVLTEDPVPIPSGPATRH
jgi:hypothetical protein